MLALDQEPALATLADEDVLALATEQRRIVITHNIKDFAPIVRRWGEARQSHAGCILITLPHTSYGAILRGLAAAFAARPAQSDWVDRTEFLVSDR